MRFALLALAALALTACVPTGQVASPAPSRDVPMEVANFLEVVDRVEPIAERVCAEETRGMNCDFRILVDRDPRSGVNAFQTVSRRGQPLIIFTRGLIAVAQTPDELAFVLGHEAGHHIARHIEGQRVRAAEGARVFSQIARQSGADDVTIGEAAQIGSIVAARRFSQAAELEADAIGTVIAFRSGYDPLLGASFFNRLPDPDGAFLSTHPPNAARFETVRRATEELRAGRPLGGS